MFRPSLRRCALRPQHVPRRWNTSPVKPSILGEPVALTVPIAPQPYQPIGDALPKPPTWRPIFFVLGVFGATYFAAAKLTNDETEKWSLKVYTGAWWQTRLPSSEEMQRLARLNLTEKLTEDLRKLNEKIANLPAGTRAVIQRLYITTAQSWVNMPEGRQAAYALVGIFVGIHLFKTVGFGRVKAFFTKNFVHDPLSGRSFTLLTANFGHDGLFHLAVNSIALLGFGQYALQHFRFKQITDPERMIESHTTYHFIAFHIAAGVFASLVSHLIVARIRFPRLLAALSKSDSTSQMVARAERLMRPSLGASGAVYASLTVTALAYPHAQVYLIFLPMIPISIPVGFGGMLLADVIGLWRGWGYFDHAAHLGGAAFGMWYFYYGPDMWDSTRRQWYKLKGFFEDDDHEEEDSSSESAS